MGFISPIFVYAADKRLYNFHNIHIRLMILYSIVVIVVAKYLYNDHASENIAKEDHL